MEQDKPDYSDDQRKLDDRLTADAISMKLLGDGSTVEQLTNQVRQNMSDTYMLRDAIDKGVLPPGSTLDDLTNTTRQELLDANKMENPNKMVMYTAMGKKAAEHLVLPPLQMDHSTLSGKTLKG